MVASAPDALAPVALEPTGTDVARLEQLARRRLRSRGLASPRLDHQGSRTIDPRPRLFDPVSWRRLEAATAQRFRLLSALAEDLYGRQATLGAGVVPAELVFGNPAFALAASGWRPAGGRRVVLAAFDFVCDPVEGWLPVRDHLTAPTELGRALENREILTQLLPADQHRHRVRRLAHFQAALRRGLAALAPPATDAPRVLLLSPGREHDDHPELAELARMLGYTVAEAADLTVRRGSLFLSSLAGLEAVHVLARFAPDAGADPLELPGGAQVGIAGLLTAARRGTVTVANALGVGLLESPVLGTALPAAARHLLGEDLVTGGDGDAAGAAGWWCGDATARSFVTERLAELELHGLDVPAPIDGASLDAGRRAALRARIEAEPTRWSARRPVPAGSEVLRTYAVFDGRDVQVMPGGYATVAGAGRLSADVWVPQEGGGRFVDLPVRVAGLSQVDFAESLPSRAGESMFWLGRHLERAEAIVRLARTVLDRAEQEPVDELPAWLVDLTEAVDRLTGAPWSGGLPLGVVDAALRQPDRWDGLPNTVSQLLHAAGSARELLSVEVWDGITALREEVHQLSTVDVATDIGVARDHLDRVLADLSSVAGVIHESMLHGPGWRLLDAGRRIERALHLVTLLDAVLHDRPGQVEDEILEALLLTGVSLVAYRRRHRSDLELEAVLAILVLDPSNPRSVRHAIGALVEDIADLPMPQRPGGRVATYERARDLLDLVAGLRSAALANRYPSERPGDDLPHTLRALAEGLTAVSEALQDVYMRHVTMARLPADSTRPGPPPAAAPGADPLGATR